MSDKSEILADESLIILHSGEIPEVAYHECLHHLSNDPEGPGLELEPRDLIILKKAVVARYRKIILRDLTPKNRDKRIYRGIARSIVNWERLKRFSVDGETCDLFQIRKEIAEALLAFLDQEAGDVACGTRKSCINCSASGIMEFAESLGIAPDVIRPHLAVVCQTG